MGEYRDIAPAIYRDGPAWDLMREHDRRLLSFGPRRFLCDMTAEERRAAVLASRTQWHSWDAEDYCLDAPDVMPAGACWYAGPWIGIEQRTVRRGA